MTSIAVILISSHVLPAVKRFFQKFEFYFRNFLFVSIWWCNVHCSTRTPMYVSYRTSYIFLASPWHPTIHYIHSIALLMSCNLHCILIIWSPPIHGILLVYRPIRWKRKIVCTRFLAFFWGRRHFLVSRLAKMLLNFFRCTSVNGNTPHNMNWNLSTLSAKNRFVNNSENCFIRLLNSYELQVISSLWWIMRYVRVKRYLVVIYNIKYILYDIRY